MIDKNSILKTLLNSADSLLKSDKALAVSLIFCFGITFVVLEFSSDLINNMKDALLFILGISILFVVLNFVLNSTQNYSYLIGTIEKIFSRFFDIPHCKKCHKPMKIYPNKIKHIYFWKCEKHPKNTESILLKCPNCKNKSAIQNRGFKFAKCKSCNTEFFPSEVNLLIEQKYKCLIKEKFSPKYRLFNYIKTVSLENIVFLLVFSILVTLMNYLSFSVTGKQILASLLFVNMS